MELIPRLIFWEITTRCNLRCPYCRGDRFNKSASPSLEGARQIIDSIAEAYRPLVVFSGGEPLLYPYLWEVASYARQKGLEVALATNGTLVDDSLAQRIKAIGFHRVAISLDGVKAATHDFLRGEGTFLKSLGAIKCLKSYHLPLQINTTVFRKNFREIRSLYQFCLEYDLSAFHIFAFVPVGCGLDLRPGEILTKEEYEWLLSEIADLSIESKIEIKLTCAPHYQRILLTKLGEAGRSNQRKGCLAGSGVCFISNSGEVYPCGYLKLSAGNILKNTFKEIWTGSSLFQALRAPHLLKGRCRNCEYLTICGGCRARAYIQNGDYLGEEPACLYQPKSFSPNIRLDMNDTDVVSLI